MKTTLCVLLLLVPGILLAAITLEWDYVDNPLAPAASFSMYRDVGCTGAFLFLASIPRSTLLYRDGTADQAGQRYCYQVTAIGATGEESGASNTVAFQVPSPRPNAPTNLRGSFTP